MNSILSIQSHVVYGYVGNKAATFPLQCMGYDVSPINTVQFSNHTGYKKWQGEVCSASHILSLAQGLMDVDQVSKCGGIISGYMASESICSSVQKIVRDFKDINRKIIYLCDPVIGDGHCYVKPEVADFFKNNLYADIITPNQFEAEFLSGITITSIDDMKLIAQYFHDRDIDTVIITGISLPSIPDYLFVFASSKNNCYLIKTDKHSYSIVSGTGDLFSSLYLGFYLKTLSIKLALQNTVYYVLYVLQNTYDVGERELQVLSARYDLCDDRLPNISTV